MPTFGTNTFRISVVSAAIGIALIGALAMFFRRRKRRRTTLYRDMYIRSSESGKDAVIKGRSTMVANEQLRRRADKTVTANGGKYQPSVHEIAVL